jgi:hypothetical protein
MSKKPLRITITADVVDSRNKKGIPGLRVEAWDKDEKCDDFLAVGTTDAGGQVKLDFSEGRWREYAPDLPDVYFKVYRGRKEMKAPKDKVIRNVKRSRKVTVEIERPVSPPSGKDRVSAGRVFKTLDFLTRTDWRGTATETRDTIRAPVGLAIDRVASFAQNPEPIKPGKFRHSDIVGRDLDSVRRHLESNDIEINDVKTYDPKAGRPALTDLRSFPARLKPDKPVKAMTVYCDEKNVVRYYVDDTRAAPTGSDLAGAVEAQEARLDEVKRELQVTREAAEEKDRTIDSLRQEIETLRAVQREMTDVFSVERMTRIERDIESLKKHVPKVQETRKRTRKKTSE